MHCCYPLWAMPCCVACDDNQHRVPKTAACRILAANSLTRVETRLQPAKPLTLVEAARQLWNYWIRNGCTESTLLSIGSEYVALINALEGEERRLAASPNTSEFNPAAAAAGIPVSVPTAPDASQRAIGLRSTKYVGRDVNYDYE